MSRTEMMDPHAGKRSRATQKRGGILGARGPLGLLVVVFIATALCFIASTVYTVSRVHELRDHSEDVSANALPSVVHLDAARIELRHLERSLTDALDGRQSWMSGTENAALRRIDDHLNAYAATEEFPGEHELWVEAQKRLAVFRAAVTSASHRVATGEGGAPPTDLRTHLQAATNDLDRELDRLSTLNADQGEAASFRVRRTRRA
jgi:hypothetical protein